MGATAARVRDLAGRAAGPAIGLAAVVILGADLFFLTQRDVTTPLTLGQTGNVQGSSRFEVWVHPENGLALRELVHVQSRSHAFGTAVDYREAASYILERLTPTT